MFASLRAGAGWYVGLAVGCGLWATGGSAQAQNLPTHPAPATASPAPAANYPAPTAGYAAPTAGYAAPGCDSCGGGGCSGCGTREKTCGPCGLRIYPLFEKRYIRQFCKPTICAGSCFGHFKTQWTPWGQACPNWGDGSDLTAAAGYGQPGQPGSPTPGQPAPGTAAPGAPMPPPSGTPLPTPKPTPAPAPETSQPKPPMTEPAPMKPLLPQAPAPKPLPMGEKPPASGAPGVSLPPVPDMPVWTPAQPAPPRANPVRY